MSIAENLAAVRRRVAEAARRSGRGPEQVTLVAISKTFGLEAVREAWTAGQRDFGENRVQEALQKMEGSADMKIRWHLVGHLQSNKARKAAAAFAMIHSVDSRELLDRLNDAAGADKRCRPQILIQVDLAGESTKFGAPEAEAVDLVRRGVEQPGLELVGLMLLPPWSEDPEVTRPWFVRLRALRDRLLEHGVPPTALRHLSMGMSQDFEVAIEEGSTLVRVGTAIFGKREARP